MSLNKWAFSFFHFLVGIAIVSHGIRCNIGYGQRGLMYGEGISWTRTCPNAKYCFEAVTNKMEKMITLFDYPWDSYYAIYYVRGCGGEFGTPLQIHPYKANPAFRNILGAVKINITTPHIVTGQGGKEEFDLNWECRKDYCTVPGNSANSRRGRLWDVASVVTMVTFWMQISHMRWHGHV